MNDATTETRGFSIWVITGTWTDPDGRHFCGKCHKLLRAGQRVVEKISPAPFRRCNSYYYCHVECPRG